MPFKRGVQLQHPNDMVTSRIGVDVTSRIGVDKTVPSFKVSRFCSSTSHLDKNHTSVGVLATSSVKNPTQTKTLKLIVTGYI